MGGGIGIPIGIGIEIDWLGANATDRAATGITLDAARSPTPSADMP